jgi:hypothetical protein
MVDFEWALAGALNEMFESRGIAAIAYRLKQSRYTSQGMDILVDSIDPRYYLAIECKSLDARVASALYFSQHFGSRQGGHQIIRESEFLRRSGRKGLLAIELRRGPGKPRSAHLIPWKELLERFNSGIVGFEIEEIESHGSIQRNEGKYVIGELIV